jgi:hypothetical protein
MILPGGAGALGIRSDLKARRVHEDYERDIERVAQDHEVDDLATRVSIERAATMQRIVRDYADALPAEPRKCSHCTAAKARLQLE